MPLLPVALLCVSVSACDSTGDDEPANEVRLIEEQRERAGVAAEPEDSEFARLHASIDWSDRPEPRPVQGAGKDSDIYTGVTQQYIVYFFEKYGYTADRVANGETEAIPPVLLLQVPKGWAEDITVQLKKSLFYRVMLPLMLYENETLLAERRKLLDLDDRFRSGTSISGPERDWLLDLSQRFRVREAGDPAAITTAELDELRLRVDAVPPSLALGQAAYESGYGTSRFAHTGNALFGQWDWSKDAIKPEQQRKGKGDYGIKAFETPLASVHAYMWNLNTHPRYADFRRLRQEQRGENQSAAVSFDAFALAATLLAYSERGEAYVKDLQGIMRFNNLQLADGLRLLEGPPVFFYGAGSE